MNLQVRIPWMWDGISDKSEHLVTLVGHFGRDSLEKSPPLIGFLRGGGGDSPNLP